MSDRRNWNDLWSLVALVPAVISLSMGHVGIGALLWLAACVLAFSIGPIHKPAWWGTIFFVPVLFFGAVLSWIAIPLLFLSAPIIIPIRLFCERRKVRKIARSVCSNCGQPFAVDAVRSALDAAYSAAFDAVDSPLDIRLDTITVQCGACGHQADFPW